MVSTSHVLSRSTLRGRTLRLHFLPIGMTSSRSISRVPLKFIHGLYNVCATQRVAFALHIKLHQRTLLPLSRAQLSSTTTGMPLGFERLNERSLRPNANINFIKPLDTPDRATAQAFLERIAAQCYPVMKRNYISVMSLEEFPPNREFLGRNFNAGECIQLVLKDRHGRWLSFNFVQMVMMHELAHCKQMNHSRAFWAVRNGYAEEMKALWHNHYTGEGMWGRGRDLSNGDFVHDRQPDSEAIPKHLCGGTYRRARGKKRKRGQTEEQASNGKPKLSYAERQQRRIARRFGAHGDGNALGDDELVRGALKSGPGKKRGQGKPKVANSKRGRELRASAALARIEALQARNRTVLDDDKVGVPDNSREESSETESDEDDLGAATDIADIKLEMDIDENSGFVRVCGDEANDEGEQKEIQELRVLGNRTKESIPGPPQETKQMGTSLLDAGSETESEPFSDAPLQERPPKFTSAQAHEEAASELLAHEQLDTPSSSSAICQVCSLENPAGNLTCSACANVLKPKLMPGHWHCNSDICKPSPYINAGDVGRCGICGTQKPLRASESQAGGGSPYNPGERVMGATSAELLRWD